MDHHSLRGRAISSAILLAVIACVLTSARCALAETSSSADTMLLGALPRELEQGEDKSETIELNRLGLVQTRVTKVSLLGLPIIRSDAWLAVRGKYRYGLSRPEFFEWVGREDLADQQRARDTWSDVLFYGGFVTAVAGIVYPFVARDAEDGVQSGDLIVGLAIFGGGVVITNVGAAMSGPVLDARHAAALAERYNRALERRVLTSSMAGTRSAAHGFSYRMQW